MIKYTIKLIAREDADKIITEWHYSHSINGVMGTYYFGLFDEEILIGAIIFGQLAMANVWKKYVTNKELLLELRRLAIIDDTPKNTESFFIGYCLRWLKKNTNIQKIISYADSNYGHTGTIYKASNFELVGMTKQQKIILWQDKKYHDKAIRTKYKGDLKPFAKRLRSALERGSAKYVLQTPKYCYVYILR